MSILRTIEKALQNAERRPNGRNKLSGRRFSAGFSLKFSIHSPMEVLN
jgi:hypothetical protein